MPPWRSKSTSEQARRSEQKGAKLSGGFRVPMSGAGRQKGDIKTPTWLIEDKTTAAVSYRIELATLEKISHESRQAGRLPQMRITISGQTWRLLRESDYLDLIER